MKQVAAGVLKILDTIFNPYFLANSEAIKKNKINRLKIITEICFSYHILTSPLDWGEGFNNSIIHLYPTHCLRNRLWLIYPQGSKKRLREETIVGKNPTQYSKVAHPRRDVSNHQNKDADSTDKKIAPKMNP